MTNLERWTAKRAGGRITIYGTDCTTKAQMKVVGVDRIESPGVGAAVGYSAPVATDRDGMTYLLT